MQGRELDRLLKAAKAGVIISQRTGAAPDAAVGMLGAIALDSKSGHAYTKTAGGWVQIAGVNLGAS